MCCEICPSYTNCEELGHFPPKRLAGPPPAENDLCCISCPDYPSCHDEGQSKKDGEDEPDDELGGI